MALKDYVDVHDLSIKINRAATFFEDERDNKSSQDITAVKN